MNRVFPKDGDFLRGYYENGKPVPLTKYEVRVLSAIELEIDKNDLVLDIGAGSGGMTVQAALLAHKGKVISVERSPMAGEIIKRNCERQGIENVEVVIGSAPRSLEKYEEDHFNKIFVGGSNGNLESILNWCLERLDTNAKVCANFITIENCEKALRFFKKNFKEVSLKQVQINRGRDVGASTMMLAENPVYILTGSL